MQHTGIYCVLSLLTAAAFFIGVFNFRQYRNQSDWLQVRSQLTEIVKLPTDYFHSRQRYQGLYEGYLTDTNYCFKSDSVFDFARLKTEAVFYVNPNDPEDYHEEYSSFDRGKGFLLLCVPLAGVCALQSTRAETS